MKDSQSKIKILFILGSLGYGGTETQIFNYLLNIDYEKYEPVLIIMSKNKYQYKMEKKLIDKGVLLIDLSTKNNAIFKLLNLTRVITKIKPDLLYSAHFYTNVYAGVAGQLFNIPSIGSIRSDYYNDVAQINSLHRILSLKLVTIIIANSNAGMKNLKTEYSDARVRLINNFINSDVFYFKSKEKSQNIKIITVGRLTNEKRIDRFINIIKKIKDHVGDSTKIVGLVCGSGRESENLKSKLSNQIKNIGLNNDELILLGDVDNISDFYRTSDLFLFTSEYEGSPNCVWEAMACGLPVITTNVGNISEIISHKKNGFIVDTFNEKDFIKYSIMLLNDDSLKVQIRNNAISTIKNNFSLSRYNKEIDKLFYELIND
ncbi:MAG: hypothetical protein CMI96_01230 [Pelagibacteraceae bacterium]|nr:hypothetical protein [Pelagibacteraceae bacterium]|tara:strand:+ start:2435 stop:3556 length:1122 start_codon:yes stop_codon:yes gene_type:complete